MRVAGSKGPAFYRGRATARLSREEIREGQPDQQREPEESGRGDDAQHRDLSGQGVRRDHGRPSRGARRPHRQGAARHPRRRLSSR